MDLVLKILGGKFGGFVLAAAGVTAALLLTALTVQSLRLDRAAEALGKAKAALVNPVTGKTWQAEAVRDGAALSICRGSVDRLERAIGERNREVDRWREDGQRLVAEAQAARARAAAAGEAADRSARALAARPSAATCEAREAAAAALAQAVTR